MTASKLPCYTPVAFFLEIAMIAVIETGGKQYTVEVGTKITIEKLPEQTGEQVVFSRVLLTSDNGKTEIGMPFLETTVEGKILDSGRDEKIRVYKMHAKKRYQKTQGHRQSFVSVQITGISGKGALMKAEQKEAAPKAVAPKTIQKTETVKKPAVKKAAPAAPKKTPVKKAPTKKAAK